MPFTTYASLYLNEWDEPATGFGTFHIDSSANAISENAIRVRKSATAFMANDSSGHRPLSMMTTAMTRKGDMLNMGRSQAELQTCAGSFHFGRADGDCNMAAVD